MLAETRRRWGSRAERDSAELPRTARQDGNARSKLRGAARAATSESGTRDARGAPREAAMIERTQNFLVDPRDDHTVAPQGSRRPSVGGGRTVGSDDPLGELDDL